MDITPIKKNDEQNKDDFVFCVVMVTGYKRFSDDIYMMLGTAPNKFYMVCWLGITPATLVVSCPSNKLLS